MPAIDQYSFVSIPLEMVSNGQKISTATGFFYTRNERPYLVSNWHVFSGRNPIDGQAMDKNAAIPDQVVFPIHLKDRLGRWRENATSNLVNNNGNPTWFQHRNGQAIDIAVLPSPDIPDDCIIYDPVKPDETNMAFMVGMDVFVVGFPLGLAKQGIFPVWKRGSVSSEPDLPVDGLPLFLVDTATRQGMSGSPVYVRTFGSALLEDGNSVIGPGTFTRFLGVYSGRYGADDEFAAQLGRVWHRPILDELIDNGVQGSYVIR